MAKAALKDKAAEAEKVLHPLQVGSLRLAEMLNNMWGTVATDVSSLPEDYDGNPAMWAFVGAGLTLYDRVSMVAADGSWWAEYLVVQAGSLVNVILLRSVNLPERSSGDLSAVPGFSIRLGSPAEGGHWLAERLSDGVILNIGERHTSKEDARRFILDHASVRSERDTTYFPR